MPVDGVLLLSFLNATPLYFHKTEVSKPVVIRGVYCTLKVHDSFSVEFNQTSISVCKLRNVSNSFKFLRTETSTGVNTGMGDYTGDDLFSLRTTSVKFK